ncbi:hypothetical protein KAX08_03810, partial [candidate division WOR-3 bacterium]|nr:hypothetical protein [candidate division WOR-3 bacterium]
SRRKIVSEIIFGNFNAEAIKAIKKSLKSKEINPLYIHGPYGSGKSFLVQKMEEEYKGKSITIEATKIDPSLINEYLDYDLFILSDLELLPLRSPIPETIFDILSYYIEKKKQIVFTSDRPPYALKLSERIISRIERGVTVKIKPFDKTSREKVIKTLGKDLPPKIINNLIDEDIETISQAIGAIKKARVLGYVVKRKEEREKTKQLLSKKTMGEFDNFVNDIRETFSETIDRSAKEHKLREEYSSKMYVWKMKGFNADRIKKVIDGPIDKLTSEFVSFTMDIQRLIELQRQYGAVNIKNLSNMGILSKEEIKDIEKALFNPDKTDWLSIRISELENQEEELLKKPAEVEIKEAKKETSSVNIDKLTEELKIDLNANSFRFLKEF